MSDEHEAPRGATDQRGAVARLTEAVAAAQAVARESAAELGVGAEADAEMVGSAMGEDDAPATEAADPTGPASGPASGDGVASEAPPEEPPLRDRLDALPMLGGDDAGRGDADGPRGDVADGPDRSAAPPGSGTAVPHPAARGARRRFWPLYLAMAVLILAVPALAWTGYRIAADSTAGEVLSGRSRPDSPGYTALTEPTPVALVMQVSDSGQAQGLTVLSLSGPDQKGGTVIASPVDVRLSTPRLGIKSFAGIIEVNSPKTAGGVIGSELGLGFTEVIEVTDSELVTLLEPVAPLEIDNPEEVTEGDGDTIDPGPVELAAADVPAYLTAEDAGHTVSGRLARQQLVWKAWIDKIAQHGGTAAIPGESDVGLGHFLGNLAAGSVQSTSFPVTSLGGTDAPHDDGPTVKIDRRPAMLLIADAVPFPVAAVPGDRATVALLNGTGPNAAPASVIQRLTFAGAQITTIGNAPRFDHAVTTLTYTDSASRLFALAMARQLGKGRVVQADTSDTGVDVAVVLGRDLMSDPPGPLTAEEVGTD